MTNNNLLDNSKIKIQKNLRSSLSQGIFEVIRKQRGAIHNLSLDH